MGKLFLGLIAATLLEIFVFIEVGSELGAWLTIALIILTAVIGLSLVRIQGFYTLMEVQRKINLGEPPAREMLSGIMLAVSGVLLVLPGFVSDLGGLILLLPPVRNALATRLIAQAEVQRTQGGHTYTGKYYRTDNTPPPQAGVTFEGDFERKEDRDKDK